VLIEEGMAGRRVELWPGLSLTLAANAQEAGPIEPGRVRDQIEGIWRTVDPAGDHHLDLRSGFL